MSSLTERREAQRPATLERIRQKWIEAGLATGPTDRAHASAALGMLYELAGLGPPRFVWLAGPLALVEASISPRYRRLARVAARMNRDRHVATTTAWFDREIWAAAERVRDAVDERVRLRVGEIARLFVAASSFGRRWPDAGSILPGQHEAAGLALSAALRAMQIDSAPSAAEAAREAVAASAGWVLPLDGVCLVADRPAVLRLDERGRLHARHGPALAWADGTEIWAWQGVVMPPAMIREPERISTIQIAIERDPARRRAMIELVGFPRWLAEAPARLEHEDETGRLWSARFHEGLDWAFVEVENGTPEPDGSRRRYWLQVPLQMRTAREAVAWTYGLSASEYDLRART